MARGYDSGCHQIRPPAAPNTMSKKMMGLHQIVRLRQMVVQWRHRAASNIHRTLRVMSPRNRKQLTQGASSACRRSSPSSSTTTGSAREVVHGRELLPPEGYLAIYVGGGRRRFEIRAEHVNHPLLRGLLQRTEEEYGLNQQGGLAIPACEVVLFEHMLWMVQNDEDMQAQYLLDHPTELRELLDLYMHSGATSCAQEANLREASTSTSALSSGYGMPRH